MINLNRASCALLPALIVGLLANAGTADAQAQPAPRRPNVEVVISADGTIQAPARISGGIVHLTVAGSPGEALELAAPRAGGSLSTLVSDYRRFSATGLPRRTEHDFRLVGGALVGADLYLDLGPGTYYAYDAAQPTLSSDRVATIVVTGHSIPAELPRITGTVAAIGHDRWAKFPRSIRTGGHLLFTNMGTEPHLVNLLQLRPGTTLADVQALFSQPGSDPSSISTGVYDELGVLSPGRQELVSYALPAGTYAVLDLWPDDTTGEPHSALGMVRLLRVTPSHGRRHPRRPGLALRRTLPSSTMPGHPTITSTPTYI